MSDEAVVNLAQTGRLDAGVAVDRGDSAVERIRLSALDLLELSDAEGKGLLASPLWGVGALVLALAAAVVRERYGREALSAGFRILGEGQLTLTKFLLLTDTPQDLRPP